MIFSEYAHCLYLLCVKFMASKYTFDGSYLKYGYGYGPTSQHLPFPNSTLFCLVVGNVIYF